MSFKNWQLRLEFRNDISDGTPTHLHHLCELDLSAWLYVSLICQTILLLWLLPLLREKCPNTEFFSEGDIYIYHLLKCSFSYINRKNYHPTPQKWSLSEPVFSSYKHPETRSTSNFIVVWKQWLNWKEHLGNSKCFV